MDKIAFTIGGNSINAPAGIPNGDFFTSGQSAIQLGVQLVFLIAIIVVLFSLVYAGIKWIMSEGKKENIESARNQIIYSIIGLAIILLSVFLVRVIGTFFGITFFQ